MELSTESTPEIPAIRAALLLKGHRSLRAWAKKRKVNYNTAHAALHGLRAGPKAKQTRILLLRDAQAAA